MTFTHAAVTALQSHSPEEDSLVKYPLLSYFVNSFAQVTKYVKQLAELKVQGTQAFDETLHIQLNRNDMMGRVYIIFTLPGIRHLKEDLEPYDDSDDVYKFSHSTCSSSSSSSSSTHRRKHDRHNRHRRIHDSSSSCDSSSSSSERKLPKHFVHWENAIGHVLVEQMAFQIGGETANPMSGEYMEVLDVYTTKSGASTNETIGRYKDQYELWLDSRRTQQRVVRCRFHFCEHISKSLPIFAIRKTPLRIELKVRSLKGCYYSSDHSVPHLINEDTPLAPHHIRIQAAANIYHLTKPERALIFASEHVHLMTQVQELIVPVRNDKSAANFPIPINLKFKHPVSELVWAIQDDRHLGQRDWYNYSGVNGDDPLVKFKLTIDGKDLFPLWPGKWFRTIEPLETHKKIPGAHLYNLCFCECPDEETFHSGFLNFTPNKIDMHLMLQRGLGPIVHVKIWAKTVNLFRIKNGECGIGWI